MKKFIRIALPLVCFVFIIWYSYFRGINHLNWKWLVGAVGIGAVCVSVLYVKRHKVLCKREELRNQLKIWAEEAVVSELENVNGNSLKKELVKRRLVREYLEKNTDYYAKANDAICNVEDWISSLLWSIYLLCLPFLGIIFFVVVLILLVLLFYWPFSTQMAICCVMSVVASIVLVWRCYYVLTYIAIGLAAILLYGLFNDGIYGVEMLAYDMVVESYGYIFLGPLHAEYSMWGSVVLLNITSICLALYPLLKKKTLVIYAILVLLVIEVIRFKVIMCVGCISTSYFYYPYVLLCAMNADIAVMLGISQNVAFIVLYVYLAWLFPVIFALPAFIRSWRRMGELKDRLPLAKKNKYRHQYYICLVWLIMNLLAATLVWGHFIGIPTEQCAKMLYTELSMATKATGINFFIVYCLSIPFSALVSYILHIVTKHKIKLQSEND